MRVRFIGSVDPGGERHGSGFLTVGNEYVVLSIIANDSRGVEFLVLGDETGHPLWHRASVFDLVSTEVPSNWRIAVGAAGIASHVEIGPEPWLEPGFFTDYWGDGDDAAIAAQETFKRELETILRES